MGIMALGLIILSVFAGVATFYIMKTVARIPLLLNLPGAILVGAAFFLFSGWMTSDMFANHVGYPPSPDISWHQPFKAICCAFAWYFLVVSIVNAWRNPPRGIPKWYRCYAENCTWVRSNETQGAQGQCKSCKNSKI